MNVDGNTIFDEQMTTYDMAALEELVEGLKPKVALEVGSWKGQSTSILARHCNLIYCVDTWQGNPEHPEMVELAKNQDVFKIFYHNMVTLGQWDKIKAIMTSSKKAFEVSNNTFDFIYIDAGHGYDDVKQDLKWFDRVNPGGVIAGHDYDSGHKGVMNAVFEKFGERLQFKSKSSIWYVTT